MNQLAAGWENVQLGEICRLINGRAYKKNELLDEGKYPVLRVGNFFSNRSWYYSDLELGDDKYCDDDDLLYAWSASFGPRIWQGGKVIYHYHIWKTEIDQLKVLKEFLFYWFDWDTEKIKSEQGAGTTMIHVTKGSMEKRGLLLPPLPEQKRIVAILDEAFAGIAQAVANAEKNLANARELFESYLNNVFTQKGDDWEETPLDEHIRFIDYRGKTPKKTTSGLRLITAKNVKMGFLQRAPEEFVAPDTYDDWMTRGIPKRGDVLFTTEAPLGLVCQLDTDEKVVFAQRIITMQPDRDILNSEFLSFALRSAPLQLSIHERGTGATVKGIKASLLKKITLPFPSLPAQETIAEHLTTLSVETKHLETIYQQKLTALKELKQSILQKAFAGELTADVVQQQANG